MSESRDSGLFQALILQLAQAGWMGLGKIPNPMTGKVERSLELARVTIDTLGALETRTRGNLDEDEKRLLERTVRELRLNFVDEAQKPASGAERPEGGTAEGEMPGVETPGDETPGDETPESESPEASTPPQEA